MAKPTLPQAVSGEVITRLPDLISAIGEQVAYLYPKPLADEVRQLITGALSNSTDNPQAIHWQACLPASILDITPVQTYTPILVINLRTLSNSPTAQESRD